MADVWLPFDGSASDQGETYHLTPRTGNGVIAIDKDDVRLEGGKVEVRLGTMSKTIQESTGGTPPPDFAPPTDANCPGVRTMCIGLLLFCCSNGKLIGACIGFWSCH